MCYLYPSGYINVIKHLFLDLYRFVIMFVGVFILFTCSLVIIILVILTVSLCCRIQRRAINVQDQDSKTVSLEFPRR